MNLLDLMVTLSIDSTGYKKGLKEAQDGAEGLGDASLTSSGKVDKLGSALKKGLGASAKIGAAAVTAAAVGIASLTKKAIENYAEYEQLVGGVETLFKESSAKVQAYADNAYKSANMSANEYMETVTGFSASLLQSLDGDTAKAADYANRAIIDMADNANKMGTSMEMLQNTYQGFAKQNYTMLDNLKLGYGGTKEEMQRLIKDAAALKETQAELGVTVDASSMSFDNIVNAISVMQAKMGIAGATAAEASSTISGSVAAMKAAWSNLVTGFANENADLNVLIDNFFNSVATVAENVGPRIGVAVEGVTEFILTTAQDIIPQVVEVFTEKLPLVAEKGGEIAGELGAGLIKAIPQLVKKSPQLVLAILEGIGLMTAEMVMAGVELVMQLIAGIGSMISPLVQKAKETIKAFGDALKEQNRASKEWGADLISNFINGIKSKIGDLANSVKGVASTVWSYLHFSEPEIGPLSDFHTYAPDMMNLFAAGIEANKPKIIKKVITLAESVSDILSNVLDENNMLQTMFGNMSELFALEYDNQNVDMQAAKRELADYNSLLKMQGDIISGAESKIEEYIDAQRIAVKEAEEKYKDTGSSADFWAWNNEKMYLRALTEGATDENVKKYGDSEAFKVMQNLENEKTLYAEIEEQILKVEKKIKDFEKVGGYEKTKKNLESLIKQQETQAESLAAAEEAYSRILKVYGKGSEEETEFRNKLFAEKIEFQELTKKIKEATLAVESYNDAMRLTEAWDASSYASRSIAFANSSLGVASAAAINSSADTQEQNVTVNANLMTPDGKNLATWILSDLVSIAKSNGTPITAM